MKTYKDVNDTTIPLTQAIEMTTLWRDKFMETFPGSTPADVFRGFVIPIESIRDIAAKFPGTGIQGVRAYICAKQDSSEPPIVTLSVILVPAIFDGEIYHDRWENPDGTSAIYDFSQPCPPCCDVTSPLHDS